MELEVAKCPVCGRQLALDPAVMKDNCIYCGASLVVPDAIQGFKREISGIASTKSSLIHANNLLEDGDYDGAMKAYKHVIETDPTNAAAYFGMFECSVKVAYYYFNKNASMERAIPQFESDIVEAAQKYGHRAVQYADAQDGEYYEIKVQAAVKEAQDAVDARKASQQNSSGCYIATAVYGSYDCPEVWTLRRYRDNKLADSWHGRMFIRGYYAVSPTIVKLFGDAGWFKKIWKRKLDAMVERLQQEGIENTPYDDKQW